jgi:hypothetical protein
LNGSFELKKSADFAPGYTGDAGVSRQTPHERDHACAWIPAKCAWACDRREEEIEQATEHHGVQPDVPFPNELVVNEFVFRALQDAVRRDRVEKLSRKATGLSIRGEIGQPGPQDFANPGGIAPMVLHSRLGLKGDRGTAQPWLRVGPLVER